MVYARGSASDYDGWDTLGWSAKEVIPLMQSVTEHLSFMNAKITKQMPTK